MEDPVKYLHYKDIIEQVKIIRFSRKWVKQRKWLLVNKVDITNFEDEKQF